ncbi:caspase family protein [Streptomyces exfoliatus]|uniref:Caspase family protein n=1 Tax=Streptomyces exfoliatus TaxID=1905 RepID=A0ABV3D1Y4_STREX
MAQWAGKAADLNHWRDLLTGAAREQIAHKMKELLNIPMPAAYHSEVQALSNLRHSLGLPGVPFHEDGGVSGSFTQQFFPCWQNGAAVLIGVSDYEELTPVKSIENNLGSLQELMVENLGIPSANVFVVKNPESNADVHEAVERAAEAADPASGALLVYFAGHGWTDSRGRLMLGLVHSSRSRLWSAFDFNNLRIQISDSQIGKRVVILDSCFAGAALDVLGPDDLASSAAIDGTYVLTAANATTEALAPTQEQYTTFTGHLISALTDGIPGGPSVISADTLFRHVERIAKERGLPLPGRQIGGDGDRVDIMPNRWRGQL